MCGIFWARKAYLSEDSARKAWQTLKHRGPDESHFISVRDEHWLGFHRLDIIGGKENSQPLWDEEGNVLVCNGEIWDREDDIRFLAGRLTPTTPLDGVDGDYAFIRISRDGDVWMGRDHVGVKPLFVAKVGGQIVAAASEAKALCSWIPSVVVEPFPPGHLWREGTGTLERIVYHNTSRGSSMEDLLVDSVRKRVEHSDRPVALLCSGGLDSSVVVSIATHVAPGRKFHAFSVQFDEEGVDSPDTEYARRLLEELDIKHTVVQFTMKDAREHWQDVVDTCETSDFHSIVAALPLYFLARHIRRETDFRVVLSGEGADELFAGYRYFLMAPSPNDLGAECKRLVQNIHAFDLMRAERCFSAHGLEIRVPYLDQKLVPHVLESDPSKRMFQGMREKGWLRDAFPHSCLKKSGIWSRFKVRLSDGCGRTFVSAMHDVVTEDDVRSCFEERFPGASAIVMPRVMPDWASATRSKPDFRGTRTMGAALRPLRLLPVGGGGGFAR